MWCRFHGNCAPHQKEEILALLGAAMVAPDPGAAARRDEPGVLFFRDCDEALPDHLEELTGRGRVRVLAVAVGDMAPPAALCWRLLAAGAADVIHWNSQENPARVVSARRDRWMQIDEILNSPVIRENLVGESPAWVGLLRQVIEAALFSEAPVLLIGPSGSGKELLARLIHTIDPRPAKGELGILDCTTIVPGLSGSEFFGHERGAFTGAVAARDGAFALANGGTLFLDEAGELPLALQAQILRVIQEGRYKRVGGNQWHETRFRLICATNRDLPEEVAEGRFRADLYYRIAGTVVRVPSLTERREDIVPLAEHFLAAARTEEMPQGFDGLVKDYLLSRAYAGNVRELKQLVNRICLGHSGPGLISIGDIPASERPASEEACEGWWEKDLEPAVRRALLAGAGLKEVGRAASDTAIRLALEEAGGNISAAARKLRVTGRALQMRRAAGRERGPADEPAAGLQSA